MMDIAALVIITAGLAAPVIISMLKSAKRAAQHIEAEAAPLAPEVEASQQIQNCKS